MGSLDTIVVGQINAEEVSRYNAFVRRFGMAGSTLIRKLPAMLQSTEVSCWVYARSYAITLEWNCWWKGTVPLSSTNCWVPLPPGDLSCNNVDKRAYAYWIRLRNTGSHTFRGHSTKSRTHWPTMRSMPNSPPARCLPRPYLKFVWKHCLTRIYPKLLQLLPGMRNCLSHRKIWEYAWIKTTEIFLHGRIPAFHCNWPVLLLRS